MLDHLIYGVPDLLDGVRSFAAYSAIEAVPGGRHLGFGTANYLVGLGPGQYLELIGPDPQDGDVETRLFGVGPDRTAGLLTWAIATNDIDALVADARAGGYEPGEPVALSRQGASGELRWRLTPHTIDATGGVVPFIIDWGATPHPSVGGLPQLGLTALTLEHPSADQMNHALAALGIDIRVALGPRAQLRARLATPRGELVLSSVVD